MRCSARRTVFLLGAAAALLAAVGSRAETFTANFDDYMVPANTALYGDAIINIDNDGVNGVLELTPAAAPKTGSFIIENFSGNAPIGGFEATFKLLMGNGTTPPADGVSFSFADDLPDSTFSIAENGAGTGLSISFDTYNNGNNEAPAIDILGPDSPRNTDTPPVGSLHYAFSSWEKLAKGTFVDVKVKADADGTVDVVYDNTVIFTNVPNAWKPGYGRFAFAARAGGSYEQAWIDDVVIKTFPAAAPVVVSYGPKGEQVAPGTPITFKVQDQGTQVSKDSIQLTVNGTKVVPTITKSGTLTTVTFNPATTNGLWASGSTNTFIVSYSDNGTPVVSDTITNTFVSATYVNVKSDAAIAASAVDKTAPGFTASFFQAANAEFATMANSTKRAEDQVRGLLMDPATGQPYVNLAVAGPNGTTVYDVENTINWNYAKALQNGTEVGSFQSPDYPDEQLPAIDGSVVDATGISFYNNAAVEVLGFLELKAGLNAFCINSDDGFVVTIGSNVKSILAQRVGAYEGGKGTSDVIFYFTIPADGIYPVRLLWEQGDGDANLEFFSIDQTTGTKILINDLTGPNATSSVKSYRKATVPSYPIAQSVVPMPDTTVSADTDTMTIELLDGSTTVNQTSVALKVDGQTVNANVTRSGQVTKISYTTSPKFFTGGKHQVELTYADSAAHQFNSTYAFTVSSMVMLKSEWALASNSGLTPGFTVRTVQSTSSTTSTAWTEDQLAGVNKVISQGWEAASVINYLDSEGAGNFDGDSAFPGLFNAQGANDNFALEAVAYIQLTRGIHRWAVNSDDGFAVTGGKTPLDRAVMLGEYNGGKGAGDTFFEFLVETNGLYPIRLIYQEGGGGSEVEWFSVDRAVGDSAKTLINDPNTAKAYKAYRFSSAAPTAITFVKQPTNTVVTALGQATFAVEVASGSVTNPNYFIYQWKANGVDIAGANKPAYTTPVVSTADSGVRYTCTVLLPGYQPVTSAQALLTVAQDAEAAKLVSAGSLLNSDIIGLYFDKPLDTNTASLTSYFTVSSGTISSIEIRPDGKVVILHLSGNAAANTTVTVNGIKDANGHTLVNNKATNVVMNLASMDIGSTNADTGVVDPTIPGMTIPLSGSDFDVLASGNDVWNQADGFHFLYEQHTGDFDVAVRVESLELTSVWSKAGIMAREKLTYNSRWIGMDVEPEGFPVPGTTDSGFDGYAVVGRLVEGGSAGEWPDSVLSNQTDVKYPNGWMRLKRSGDTFTAYRSTNGVDWVQMRTKEFAGTNQFPATVYLGLSLTSHNNNSLCLARFRDYQPNYMPVVATEPPTLTVVRSKPNVTLSWDATLGAGYKLQGADAVTGTWADVSDAVATTNGISSVSLPASTGTKFFRLVKP